jgi:hypothetical protein
MMPRKLFERASRLFQVVFAIAAITGIIMAWNAEPRVRLTYQVQSPGAVPVMVERCGNDDAREYLYRNGPDGTQFSIDLCFKAVRKNDLNFIPYATDEDGMSWIELTNSAQVAAYTKTVGRSFTLPATDNKALLELWRKGKWQARVERLAQLAARLFVFGAVCYLLLWLARRYRVVGLRRLARQRG